MKEKYIVRTDNVISKPMDRDNAIKMVKDYSSQGINAYIVSEDEGKRLENSKWHPPSWS